MFRRCLRYAAEARHAQEVSASMPRARHATRAAIRTKEGVHAFRFMNHAILCRCYEIRCAICHARRAISALCSPLMSTFVMPAACCPHSFPPMPHAVSPLDSLITARTPDAVDEMAARQHGNNMNSITKAKETSPAPSRHCHAATGCTPPPPT